MNKPLLAVSALLVACIGTAGAYVIASPGGEEEVVQQVETATPSASPTPEPLPTVAPLPPPTLAPGVTLWRWVNVTLLIPDDSGVTFEHTVIYSTAGEAVGQGIDVEKADASDPQVSSHILIDAQNGAIFQENVRDEHRALFDAVIATLVVITLDSSTAAWPYNGDPPEARRENSLEFSFIRPTPDTGLDVYGGIGDPGGAFVGITNGRSGATVSAKSDTAELVKDLTHVSPEDMATFQRWVDAVFPCNEGHPCSSVSQ